MIGFNEIKRFSKKNSSGFTFYITDIELYNCLMQAIDNKTEDYSLIPTIWGDDGLYFFEEYPFPNFLDLRERGVRFFYLNCHVLTPGIISGKEDYSREVSFAFNGLIRIHQDKVEGKQVKDCFISMLTSVIDESTGEVIQNKEYGSLFNKLKKIIKKKLVYKSLYIDRVGKVFISKKPDMTEGYANQIRNVEIDSNVQIAEAN